MDTGAGFISRIETTIGDLVETITQIALDAGTTEQEGYQLASLTIEKILEQKKSRLSLIQQSH